MTITEASTGPLTPPAPTPASSDSDQNPTPEQQETPVTPQQQEAPTQNPPKPASAPKATKKPTPPRTDSWRNKSAETLLSEVRAAVGRNEYVTLAELISDIEHDPARADHFLTAYRRDIKAGLIFAAPTDDQSLMVIGVGEMPNELIAATPTFSQWREDTAVQYGIQQIRADEVVTFPMEQAKRFFVDIALSRTDKRGGKA